jgi:uncharacterized MAPEG superfamily protein
MGVQIPVELKLLVVAVIIGFVQIVWASGAGGERDFAWLAGPRDDPKQVGTVAARLTRALTNFLETFPLFAVALIACDLAGKLGPLTLYGAALYVAGRALYVPLYASGIALVRTLVWTVSIVGIVMIIVAFFR